jgi:hypothetical protein
VVGRCDGGWAIGGNGDLISYKVWREKREIKDLRLKMGVLA